MVRYILRTVYNSVFDRMILLGEAVTNLLAAQIDFVAFKQISSLCHIGHFLAVFCTMFLVKAQTVSLCLGDSQTSL